MPASRSPLARALLLIMAAWSALLLTGCAITRDNEPTPSMATISGTIAYRERVALPPDALVRLAIADVTVPDAPARVIANLNFATEGRQVPLPFALRFDAGRLDPSRVYTVSVRIEQGARLLFVSDQRNRLDPAALPANLELVLVPAGPAAPAN
jgi:putative lipoprotein